MLGTHLDKGPIEGTSPTQPLIGDDPQSILITGGAGFALNLFRGHVSYSAGKHLRALIARTLRNQGQAKITEQDLVVTSHQQVLRLDVAMNEFLIMSIL